MTTITPARGVLPRLEDHATEWRALADELAAELAAGPSLADLADIEAQLMEQLADVRRRAVWRAEREHEQQAAARIAASLDVLTEETRHRTAPTTTEQTRARPGPPPVDPRYERPEWPSSTLPHTEPVIQAPAPPAPPAPPAETTGGYPSPPNAPGELVATTGPTHTMPDPAASPTPVQAGPRHKKGGRR
ncbi:hypothetical protein [Actinomadura macra]|uniref:hypothetical protein n=1 Tax=Actinomadura macra TaxID=46164 RepID=UPI000831A902|nr:hypothetical protein [Actinomadura macra]